MSMYDRFSDCARKVMQLANQEAQRLNHNYIGTEHILLGLVKEGGGFASTVLKNLGVDLNRIRLEVDKLVQSGPEMVIMGNLPQTPQVKRVINYSMEEALKLEQDYVGTEHILLGLLREPEGLAAKALSYMGLSLDIIREEINHLFNPGFGDTKPVVSNDSELQSALIDLQKVVGNPRLTLPQVVQLATELVLREKSRGEISQTGIGNYDFGEDYQFA